MAREAPDRRRGAVVGLEVLLPQHLAGEGVEGMEISFGAERVDHAIDDRRRAPRPAGIRDRIGTVVFVPPEEPAVGGIKTEHALPTGNLCPLRGIVGDRAVLADVVHEIDAAIGHRRAGIAATDLGPPAGRKPVGREGGADAGLAPLPVTLRATPLRPIVGPARGHRHQQAGHSPRDGKPDGTEKATARGDDHGGILWSSGSGGMEWWGSGGAVKGHRRRGRGRLGRSAAEALW